MAEVSFRGLHVVADGSNEKSWYIRGQFTFADEDDYEEFKAGIQSAFEFVNGYSVPTILTHDEYVNMHDLLRSAHDALTID